MRKYNKKRLLYLSLGILIVILAAISLYIYNIKYGSPVAQIYKDNKLIKTIVLSEDMEPFDFTVRGENGEENIIHGENGRICVSSASCPDKICVNRGYISDGVAPIVCLPNRVIIEIKNAENKADAAAE